jgi:hypothetical protein
MRCVRACAVVGVILATGPVFAQDVRPRRLNERPVVIDRAGTLRVTPHGPVAPPASSPADSCNVISTHTDANFAGGSFVVQAGFAESEVAAASYVIPASEFPIRINMIEGIFATSNATVSTTTAWSVLVWEGTPQTGTLVASYSSDGTILPHIQLGPGTQGVNVQFMIDPQDPEQIIINDNGTHTFSVGYRVDHHNSQTSNPCFVGPPTCCNAFPCTDVSGLASASGNWLKGINCGPLGCPPNGGWSSFQGLAVGCRPSGDWVIRATWSSVSCQPGVGACCMPNGSCQTLTETDCAAQGGVFQGAGSSCSTANCPIPTGACCFSTGTCLALSQTNCNAAGGTWLGAGVSCASGNTCPTGACCLPNGTCTPGMTGAACLSQGGVFRGAGSTCAGANCPQPTGACCLSNGNCLVLTQSDCGVIPGGSWKGAGTNCNDGNGNGIADACEACYADCNGDGVLGLADFGCFQTKFALQNPYADCNGDGVLGLADFGCFQTKFALGCP